MDLRTNTSEIRNKKTWRKVVSVLAAIAVFCTTYALILPAITWEKTLICEAPVHQHDDSCYEVVMNEDGTEERFLTCGLEEHEHTASCFDAPKAETLEYYCGKTEHLHSEDGNCYFEDDSTKCTLEEHVHTLACMSNPNADIETEVQWKATFADVSLTLNWAENVALIAETQIGYTESAQNYEVCEDGTTLNGYTRYGQWDENLYDDWNVSFCDFCLHYAGVDIKKMPAAKSAEEWVKVLKEKELYHKVDSEYAPKIGDIVFLHLKDANVETKDEPIKQEEKEELVSLSESTKEENVRADRVGILYKIEKDGITTIEGDLENQVNTAKYKISDEAIIGFGEVPKNPKSEPQRTIKSEPATDGAIASVTGVLPKGAEAKIEAVVFSNDDLVTYFGEDKASTMTSFVAYDIKIFVDGVEWQPDDTVHIVVEQPDIDVPTDGLAVAHIKSSDNSVVPLSSQVDKNGNISFESDGFSVYVLYLFTVDYYYEDREYHQDGMTSMYLSELFEALEIDRAIGDITSIEFSRPDYLQVVPEGEDWLLTSLQAFDSAEFLYIYFSDGSRIELNVFDAVTVKKTITENYNLVSTFTDIEVLLEKFDVRKELGIAENTTVKSITVTPSSDSFSYAVSAIDSKPGIKCTAEFTTARTCQVVFNATDESENDIACEFINITADNSDKYILWDYSKGQSSASSPKVITGNFATILTAKTGSKDWKKPSSASDKSIHTDNAPIGFAKAVITTKGSSTINPIVIDGKNYYLYVSTNASSVSNATGNNLGRQTSQGVALPCVNGQILLVAWIEDENGNKVVMPDVCVGNEGASTRWYWNFGGSRNQYIFTNDINSRTGASNLNWSNTYGTAVSTSNVFQGVQPDENGYYTLRLSDRNVIYLPIANYDELSVFSFKSYVQIKKTVLDENGNAVTDEMDKVKQFSFGVNYTPQGDSSGDSITETIQLADGQSEGFSGVINSNYRVWEIVNPLYATSIKINGNTVTSPITETITDAGNSYQIIRPVDQKYTTDETTIEFINQKNSIEIKKVFTNLSKAQLEALRDNETNPFTIIATGNQKTYNLSLKKNPGEGFFGYTSVSDDGMTYTWEIPAASPSTATQYVISESNTTLPNYACVTNASVSAVDSRGGAVGTITENTGTYTVNFPAGSKQRVATIQNSYLPLLTVTKTVEGSTSVPSTAFPVRIQVSAQDNTALDLKQFANKILSDSVTGIEFKQSDASSSVYDIVDFNIAHDGSFSIPIAAGSKVVISEQSHDGYYAKIDVTSEANPLIGLGSGDRYTLSQMPDTSVTAAITNTAGNPLPNTGGKGVYPFYIVGAMLILGSLAGGFLLRRKNQ